MLVPGGVSMSHDYSVMLGMEMFLLKVPEGKNVLYKFILLVWWSLIGSSIDFLVVQIV